MPVGQGFRSDLAAPIDVLKSGGSIRHVAVEFPEVFVKYHGGLSRVSQFLVQPTTFTIRDVFVMWGPTGSGKTSLVYNVHGIDNVYKKSPSTGKWFDGYFGQQVLLLDDVRYDAEKRTLGGFGIDWWLNILDIYPVQVEVKGAFVWMTSTLIYVTSNEDPSLWWHNLAKDKAYDPFMRRVTHGINKIG